MELSAMQLIGLFTLLIIALAIVFVTMGKNETPVPAAQPEAVVPVAKPTSTITVGHWLGLSILITASVLSAIAIDHYLLPPRPVEYRILALDDATSATTLQYLGNEGWRIVSARRAIDDDHGIYELIIMRE